MSNEIQQITPFDGYGSDRGDLSSTALARPMSNAAPQGGDAPASGGMLKRIHASLRGRYWLAIVMGLIFGTVGGYYGYRSQRPIFRAEGMIRIALEKKGVTGPNETMPHFEEFIQSQAMLISKRPIISAAMKRPEWRSSELPEDEGVAEQVAKNLTVEHPARTELIRVYYSDPSKKTSGAVVKAIVHAYNDYARTRAAEEEDKRLEVLSESRAKLIQKIGTIDRQLADIANKFGISNLQNLVEAKLLEENKLEALLHEAELQLEFARRSKDSRRGLEDMTEGKIAILDTVMRSYIQERDQTQVELNSLTVRFDTKHPQVMQAQSRLDAARKKVETYMKDWIDLQKQIQDDPSLANRGMQAAVGLSLKHMEGRVEDIRKKYEEVRKGRTEVGLQLNKYEELMRQREEASNERKTIQSRIESIQRELLMQGRVQILDEGSEPLVPFKDRRKMMGAAGALGGFGLPIVLLMVLGLMDRRYRYSDEANDSNLNVPLLGILPRLPDAMSDPEQAAVAAHCIHQIRIMLQVGANPEKRRVFMITSASTGDGKTSLTMALGLSFAASGSKTLVIDCDMVGQGLTHRLGAENVPGLIETLNLGTLRGHVRKTASKGLYVLPIGGADAVHAGVLSPQSINRLLAACREHFDIVIIDTGPILGSLEASVVAGEADGVIMAVARGQQQPLVDKALRLLRSIGARVYGIVFNRAEHRDFQRSVASASIRSISARPTEVRALLPESDESSRFGPLARSVASCLPSGEGRSEGH